MGYGQLFTELARYAGAGQARRIAEEEDLEAKKRTFREMLPLQQEAARGTAELGEEFAIRGEQRKLAAEMEERKRIHGLLAPPLEAAMPPVKTGVELAPTQTSEYGPRAPVAETRPYKVPENAPLAAYGPLYTLLGRQARPTRARTMLEWRDIANTPGHPEQAHAQGILQGIQTERKDLAKFIIGEKPVEGGTAKDIVQIENLGNRIRRNLGGDPDERARRANIYLAPARGTTANARTAWNQVFGGQLMGPEEQQFRATLGDITDTLARAREGAVIPEPMLRRLEKIAPNLNMPPANFSVAIEEFYDLWEKALARRKQLAAQPRRELAGRLTSGVHTFPGFGGSLFIEEGEGEEE